MSRKSIIVTILVVIALLVADVAAASIENRKAANAFATTQHLTVKPYVHINGWPFIVQGVRGRYRFVTVQADPAHTSGAARVTIHPLRLSLYGVRTKNGFTDATAERAEGTARIGYRSLSSGLGQRVRFVGAGRVSATVKLRVNGKTYRPSVSARPEVSGDDLVFRSIDTTDQKGLPQSALGSLERVFAQKFVLGTFPFGLRTTRVSLAPTGMTFKVTGKNLQLHDR